MMYGYSMDVIRRAEKILGYGITNTTGERHFTLIDGVIYTDLFTGEATVPGYSGTFKRAFNGRVNGISYYNEIILDRSPKRTMDIALTLTWGGSSFANELKSLLDWLKDNPATDLLEDSGIRTKKIEDFSVTLNTVEETEASQKAAIYEGWSWYVRSPLIIGISPEQKNDHRYF